MMSSSTTWSLPTVREMRSMRVHLADEVAGIKIDDAGVAVAADERGHVVHVRLRRHRLHGGGDVVIDELMPDMRIEDRSEVHCLRFLCLLHFLCFLHF